MSPTVTARVNRACILLISLLLVGPQGCASGESIGGGVAALIPPSTLPADAFDDVLVPTVGATAGETGGHPGWTAGSFSVTSDGAATYSLPLPIPSGRAGMQPSVGLTYSSSAGNGLVGVGWSISGLGGVTVCSANSELEPAPGDDPMLGAAGAGANRSDLFGHSRHFCLDGARMFGTGGGEFRVWADDIARVSLIGDAGAGDSSFKVYRRDGRILTYGGSADAYAAAPRVYTDEESGAILEGAPQTFAWLLSRVEDRSGNFISYRYGHQAGQGGLVEYWPEEIVYTGHGTTEGTRTLKFVYEGSDLARPDPSVQYVSAVGFQRTRRLTRIEAHVPTHSGPVSRLEIGYRVSAGTRRSIVDRITECGIDACRHPLVVDWASDTAVAYATEGAVRPEVEHEATGLDLENDWGLGSAHLGAGRSRQLVIGGADKVARRNADGIWMGADRLMSVSEVHVISGISGSLRKWGSLGVLQSLRGVVEAGERV